MNKIILLLSLLISTATFAQKKPASTPKVDSLSTATLGVLKFRSIGPAVTSGRVVDIAVNPKNHAEYYVAAACGGVWKTVNNGVSFQPIFDGQGSYSIGCITLDPNNSNIVWVGSGENNNQRSVAYGDGIYKSEDGGKSWKNMGLKTSEHIGRIVVDATNSNTVYVAAYGPVWSAGGERGIYKTTDGGKTWKQVLFVSENTGCNDVQIDPRNSNILYAAAHQRRRHEWTYISGGPESAIYKSTDAGATWNKLTNGIPSEDKGRIGLALSPVNPDIIYAIIEGHGVYRSTDMGASWEKRNDLNTAGNYYSELVADPLNTNKIYSMDFSIQVSEDGGKTFKPIGEKNKHVDNHVIYVDDKLSGHLLVGCDGGLYESWDNAATWQFKPNLSITQFYKVSVDNATPFYNVYGGTQDNNSLGGPSRTTSANGITNADWYATQGGDGFETQVDTKDPNIVYAQYQYGGITRYDKKSGENIDIRPVEKEGEAAYRWNWDAPLVISKYSNTRLYFAANKLFKSDDRGNTWQVLSGDLSRNLDRNKLPVMGKVWSMDAVAKNQSTSVYGNCVAIAENQFNEQTIYVGTDDGLIQKTTNGGQSWVKYESFPGVPERTYVDVLECSKHNANTVYAGFNNLRMGDFKPYLFKSTDGGKSWTNISGNLPVRGSVYAFAEDGVNKDLLFVGTEFGIYTTVDGGKNWFQMKGGLPITSVRDIAIQERENDLAIATFGRGFYILDDYTPLRNLSTVLPKTNMILPIKDGLMFNEKYPIGGGKGKGFQGESFFTVENPPVAATFTYYLKDEFKTMKDKRKDAEKEKEKNKQPVYYPSLDSMHLEDREEAPYLLFNIYDESGNVVRRLKTAASKGLGRINWDFRYTASYPTGTDMEKIPAGALAMPGKYKVDMWVNENGKFTKLVEPVAFNTVLLNQNTTQATDTKALADFYKKVTTVSRTAYAANAYMNDLSSKLPYLKTAIMASPKSALTMLEQIRTISLTLSDIDLKLNGDGSLAKREFESLPGLLSRIDQVESSLWTSTSDATSTNKQSVTVVENQLSPILAAIDKVSLDIEKIERQLEADGAPYTPGRMPVWKK